MSKCGYYIENNNEKFFVDDLVRVEVKDVCVVEGIIRQITSRGIYIGVKGCKKDKYFRADSIYSIKKM